MCLLFFLAFTACATPQTAVFNPEEDRLEIKENRPAKTTPAFKFQSKTLRLDDALRLALDHNPSLQGFASRIDVASARVIQARLWPNPSFNLGSEDGAVDDGPGIDSGKITAGLSQTLPITGILGARTKAAEKKRELALINYEVKIRQLIGAVSRAFYQAILSQRLVEISENNLKLAQQLQTRAKERVKSGAASETENYRAEIEVSQSEVTLRGAVTALRTTQQNLFVLIGDPELKIEKLVGAVPDSFVSLDRVRLKEKVLSTHPAMLLAETSIEAAQAALVVSEKAWLPQPQIQVAVGRLREDEVNTVFEWGVSVPIPFFNRNQGTIAANRAQIRQSERNARSVRNQLLGRLQRAIIRYDQQRLQVKDFKDRILPLSEKSLTLVRKQQNLGKLSQIDVLDAQRTVFRAKRTYLGLLQNLVDTCVEIEQLGGQSLKSFATK